MSLETRVTHWREGLAVHCDPLGGKTERKRRIGVSVRKRRMMKEAFLWLVCSSCLLTLTGASSTERRLLEKLFQDYNLKVRPAATWDEKVMVRVGMTLVQLMGLDEKIGEMVTNVFMNMAWTDYRLSWDPKQYDDIDVLRIPPNKVWRPDIYLINNIDGQFDVALYVNVLVSYTGEVSWLPPAIYRSSCSIEVSYFPFDWQNCTMVFRSYTYDSSEVDLQYGLDEDGNEIHEAVIDENAFTENGEWQICHKPSRKNVEDDDLYEDITFYLIIERKPLFYIINIIVPCILISVLAIFVFYLPPGAGEKMTLSISVLIALTVFMLLLADRVPETSLSIPIIVSYVMFTMILVTFSVILSVVVLNLHHRTPNTHHMPLWVRKAFIHFLPKYIGMQRPHPEEPVEEEPEDDTPLSHLDSRRPGGEYFVRKIDPALIMPWRGSDSTVQLQRYFDSDSYCLILPPNLKSAISAVTYMAEQLKQQDTHDTMTDDWQYIALVVDRLFFWLFVIITTLGTLAMFLDASFNYAPDNPFP